MTGALSWFDWRISVAMLGIIGAAGALIAWQHRQDKATASRWLGYAALSLELLGLALSVFWAVNAADGAILPVIFVAGWIGMLIGRAILIPQIAGEMKSMGFRLAVLSGLLMAYAALYSSGLFHAINDASNAANNRLESSRPALALDAEIESTRGRIAALAGFADAGRAHAEESAQQAAAADYDARQRQLQADLAAARERLAGCPANHKTRCINPARAEIASLESQLSGLSPAAASNGYGSRHAEYNGLQQHLIALESRRAELSLAGQGAAQAWNADDRFIAWLFGIEAEQASRIKWLIFTAIFDLVSLAFRMVSAYLLQGASNADVLKRRFGLLVDAGLSTDDALAHLAGNRQPAASMPAYRYGGIVVHHGLAEMHGTPEAPEYVLSPEMTKAVGGADVLEALRRKVHIEEMPSNSPSLDRPSSNGTPSDRRKGVTAPCVDCGQPIVLKHRNHLRCDACRTEHERVYRVKHSRK